MTKSWLQLNASATKRSRHYVQLSVSCSHSRRSRLPLGRSITAKPRPFGHTMSAGHQLRSILVSRSYIPEVLRVLGPIRCMWGSDAPEGQNPGERPRTLSDLDTCGRWTAPYGNRAYQARQERGRGAFPSLASGSGLGIASEPVCAAPGGVSNRPGVVLGREDNRITLGAPLESAYHDLGRRPFVSGFDRTPQRGKSLLH